MIVHEVKNAYSPQMNGIAERYNRIVIDLVNTTINAESLPKHFWGEILVTINYIKSRNPHSAIKEQVPIERWYGKKPSVRHFRAIGAIAYVYIPKQKRNKFEQKAEQYIMVGFASKTKGYRLWRRETNQVIESKHVIFDERKMNYETERNNKDEVETKERIEILLENDEEENLEIEDVPSENDEDLPEVEKGDNNKGDQNKRKKIIRNPWGCKGKPKLELNCTEIFVPENIDEALGSDQAEE